jgi:trehalose 6-phosphate synthase
MVNPYDAHGTAQAIQRALSMPLEERIQRHEALMSRIRKHDVHWWSSSFLHGLKHVEQDQGLDRTAKSEQSERDTRA